MLGLLDKKRMVQMILSEKPMNEVKDVPVGLEADFGKACEACASDLIAAMKAEEPRMVVRALRQLMAMVEREDEYSEPVE